MGKSMTLEQYRLGFESHLNSCFQDYLLSALSASVSVVGTGNTVPFLVDHRRVGDTYISSHTNVKLPIIITAEENV